MPRGRPNNESYTNNRVGSPWDLAPMIKTKREERRKAQSFSSTTVYKTKELKMTLLFYPSTKNERYGDVLFHSSTPFLFSYKSETRIEAGGFYFHLHNQNERTKGAMLFSSIPNSERTEDTMRFCSIPFHSTKRKN